MRYLYLLLLPFFIGISAIPHSGIAQEDTRDIQYVSLDSLLNIKISAAAKYKQSIGEAPASVTIITSEDIDRYGYRTLDEALMSVRGFYTRNDRNYVYLGVRGFSRPGDYNNRILLLINGHTLNENVYESVPLDTDFAIDLDAIEWIEIIRGPGSALYGNNAMFTVINIITKRANVIDGIRSSVEAGSYGRIQNSIVLGKSFRNGVEIFASGIWSDIKGQDLYFEEYDDPSTNKGIAEDLNWDKRYGAIAEIKYGDFTLHGLISSREKGVPTGAWEMVFNNHDAKSLDEWKFVEFKYNGRINPDKNMMLRAYFNDYLYRGTYPYEDINWFDSNDGEWLGSEFQFRWDLREDNRLTVGAEYQNHLRADYRNCDEDTTYFDENFPFDVLSLYLQDEYQVTKGLSLTLGARWDKYSTVGSFTTPRAAIIYNPIKSGTLKLLYGEAFRAPNIYEVYYEDPDVAKANPDLKSEKIKTSEIVWEQRLSDELFGIVSLYSYEMKDLIDQIIDPSDSLSQFQNVNRVRSSGLELELSARMEKGLWGYVNYIFQNSEDADSKEKLTNSPSHIMKMGLVYPFFKHLDTAVELQYETDRTTVYETKTDPYLLANLNLSTKRLFDHMRLSLMIRNLFNTSYRLPGGHEHIQNDIPQNKRNFSVKLEYRF